MSRERFVPLTDELEETPGFPLHTCNWCVGTPQRDTKSVVALEYDGIAGHRYYGACGNHAEVLDVTNEWQDVHKRGH